MTEKTEAGRTYFEIALSALEIGSVLTFDLWIQHNAKRPVLYRKRELPFAEEQRERLRSSGIDTLLVSFEDAATCKLYLEQHLAKRLSDPKLSSEERMKLFTDSARSTMQDVLGDPLADDVEQRVDTLTESLCDLISGPKALHTAIAMMEHDYYTYTHSLHVAIYCVALARAAGVSNEARIADIGRGALMHDAGKCRLPAELLNKTGTLTQEEWRLMQSHPEEGLRILKDSGWTNPVVLDMCLNHHERLDGTGYPNALSGEQISFESRINAICDAYDAMTTDRAYQGAMRGIDALRCIRSDGAKKYDQELVEIFIRALLMK